MMIQRDQQIAQQKLEREGGGGGGGMDVSVRDNAIVSDNSLYVLR